ncbi:MAG: PAS domain S-box protein [SAR202 cluster bacterium]|nr:PAS domain S-box protein [SAR202 cluster bacterium]
MGRFANSSLDVIEVCVQIAGRVDNLIEFDHLSIHLTDHDDTSLVCCYVHGTDIPDMESGSRSEPGSLVEEVTLRRSGMVIDLVESEGASSQYPEFTNAQQAGLLSILSVPLISANQVVGACVFSSNSPGEYDSHDLILAQSVADQVSGALGNAQMFAEHLQAEQSLRDNEHRYRILVENANDAIVVIQEDRVIYHNSAWSNLLGYSLVEMGEKSFFEHVDPKQRADVREYYQALIQGTADPREHEMSILTQDGAELVMDSKPHIVTFGDRRGLMVVMRDITERKRLQNQLFQAQKMEAIGQMAGGVAHDFNNLLSVIMLVSNFAASEDSLDISELKRYFNEIHDVAESGAQLTRQLLTISRNQAIEPTIVDFNELIGSLDNILRRIIGEHINLTFLPSPVLGTVRIDRGQMDQVLINLALNARDAMPDGGELIIHTQNITLDQGGSNSFPDLDPGEYVLITVGDTGVGMSPDVMAKIFDPFFTTKDDSDGTGLGLSTCYGIIKQNGGHITADSEQHQGATFTIYLPKVDDVPRQLLDTEEAISTLTGTETILLAEDEPSVRGIASTILRSQGYTVLEGSDGREALEIALNHSPEQIDLLLTDMVMPEMDGRELVAHFRDIFPQSRVMYISGYPGDDESFEDSQDQATYALHKPFTPAELLLKVREALS